MTQWPRTVTLNMRHGMHSPSDHNHACPFAAGMDPISRRAVWDAINAAKQHAAVVLTTHSMEEADALGDRIGIMVRGRMRVLGGSLTLKQKYGNGYQVGCSEQQVCM
jgi:ABC-type multidrug transport system ATPase subunit